MVVLPCHTSQYLQYGPNASEISTYLIAGSQEIDIQIPITDRTLQFLMQSGASFDLDIALAHPWSSDVFLRSAPKDDAAALRQEEKRKLNTALNQKLVVPLSKWYLSS